MLRYLPIAAVVVVLSACGGDDDQGIAQTPARTNTQTTETSTMEEGAQVRVVLNERNGSGVSGTASLSRDDDRTEIEVEVDGAASAAVGIHAGTCDDLDPTARNALTGMQEGKLDGELDVSVQELTSEPHSIVVGEASDPQACGEIRSSQA